MANAQESSDRQVTKNAQKGSGGQGMVGFCGCYCSVVGACGVAAFAGSLGVCVANLNISAAFLGCVVVAVGGGVCCVTIECPGAKMAKAQGRRMGRWSTCGTSGERAPGGWR